MNTIYIILFVLVGIFFVIDILRKKFINALLWVVIGALFYALISSILTPIEFKKIRDARYGEVITNLQDIRESQIAHRTVTGKFNNSWDGLVNFIEKDSFVITQRRDSSYQYFDEVLSIDRVKDTTLIDTIRFVSVRDSLFKDSDRYKKMMFVPTLENKKFDLAAGFIDKEGDDVKQAVFEVKVAKQLILEDQDKDLVAQENEVIAVDQVNGAYLKIGSMDKVDTSGNWPKVYDNNNE